MNDFRGFDDRKNGAGLMGSLAGILTGTGSILISIREWWAWGWGPGNWSRSDILHAYWLAFFGHLNPSYEGDLKMTWPAFGLWLQSHRQYDAFVASFWIPFIVSGILGFLVGMLVFRSIDKKSDTYIRGGRVN